MKIYASRVKAAGFAVLAIGLGALAVWALVDSSSYVGPYAWRITQQPIKSMVFGLLAAFAAFGALLFLYWIITPLPFLVVDETGLTFQRWPFVNRTVAWADVEDITAVKTSVPNYFWKLVTLTLWVSLKPQAVGDYGGKPEVKLNLPQFLLPIPVEDLVKHLERYHAVTFSDNRTPGAGF